MEVQTQDPEMVRMTEGFVEEPPPVVDTSTAEWKKVKEFVAASSIPRTPWLFVACLFEGEEGHGVLNLAWLQLAGPLPEVKGLRVRLDRASPDEYYEFPFYPGETGIGQIGYVWLMQVPYDIASGEGVRGRVIRDLICGKVPLLTFSRETAAAGMWVSVVDLDGNESNPVRVPECRRRSGEARGNGGQSPWQSLTVDRMGWVGLESVAGQPQDVVECLVSTSRAWVARFQRGENAFVAYHPTGTGLRVPESSGVGVCAISLSDHPNVQTKGTIDADLSGAPDAETFVGPFIWEAAAFGVSGEDDVLWYFHPARIALVEYDLQSGAKKDYPAPPELSKTWALNLAQEPRSGRVHFAATRIRAPSFYAVCDTERGQWHLEDFPPASRFYVAAKAGTVHLLHVNGAVTLYTRRTTGEDADPTASEGEPGKGGWNKEALGQSARAVYLLVPSPDSSVHVFYSPTFCPEGPKLFHLMKEAGIWRRELVLSAPLPDPDKAQSLWNAPSAAVGADGQLHVACFDPAAGEVQHLWREEGNWLRERVAPAGPVSDTGIALVGGKVLIAYCDVGQLAIRLAWRDLAPQQRNEPEQR